MRPKLRPEAPAGVPRGPWQVRPKAVKPLVRRAVAVGFEPTVELPPHTLSRRAPSAARTRHRGRGYRSDRSGAKSLRPVVGEELAQQLPTLIGEHSAHDLEPVVQPAVSHEIP